MSESKPLVLSEIKPPKFEFKLTPEGELLGFDPFAVMQKVETAIGAVVSEGESQTAKLVGAIRDGFNLPDLEHHVALVLWSHLQTFVAELEVTKKLSGSAGPNS